MTQNDVRLAVVAANSTLATNNPKGVADALKRAGYPASSRLSVPTHDELTKALLDLYLSDKDKWADVVRSVPFDYNKADSSTSPETKSIFRNIVTSLNPQADTTAKLTLPKWFDTALGIILGSTTHTETGPPPPPKETSPWVYVAYIAAALAIFGIAFWALKQKSI